MNDLKKLHTRLSVLLRDQRHDFCNGSATNKMLAVVAELNRELDNLDRIEINAINGVIENE